MEETKAPQLLEATISRASDAVRKISDAYNQPWSNNPGTGVRAAFGIWITRAARHLAALTALAKMGDLAIVAEVHYRQMLEILLQVRYLAKADANDRERLAQKISAWGCVEWLEKMEPFKNREFAMQGYKEVSEQLAKYDAELVNEIRNEISRRIWYWFGRSFSQLADNVSKEGEDLNRVYHITSAQLHGSWDMTLRVTNPKPGVLEFREYPDEATLYEWAAESVDRGTQLYARIWNEIANATGAPLVSLGK